MSSVAIAKRLPSYSPESYLQSGSRGASLPTSPSLSIFLVTLLGATTLVVPAYHSKNVHITPGQVSASMDIDGRSVSVKSMWPSPSSAWVVRMLELCSCGEDDAALKEISLVTTDFKSSGRLQLLADDLAHLMSMKLPDLVLIGLLRNTYSVRAHIPVWNALLDQTEKTLLIHQKNPRVLLRGLREH